MPIVPKEENWCIYLSTPWWTCAQRACTDNVVTSGLAYTVRVDFKEVAKSAGILYIFSCYMYCKYICTIIIY